MIKHVFITGISGGIGKACVERAIKKGWVVSGCARRQAELDQLQQRFGDNIVCTVADVCKPDELERAVKNGLDRFGPLRAVVANAGRGVDGELLELSTEDIASVFDTNVMGVHRTILATQKFLVEKSAIVVVASVASFLSIPRMGAYCATKHALDAYVAALRMELHERKIAVLSMCPGTVRTDFFEAAPKPGSVWDWRPGAAMTPAQVAKGIMNQAENRRPRRYIMPWYAGFAARMYRLWPGFVEWLMRRALKKMRVAALAAESQHVVAQDSDSVVSTQSADQPKPD